MYILSTFSKSTYRRKSIEEEVGNVDNKYTTIIE